MKKLFTSLALIAAFLSTDLQWSVMQSVTWACMIQQSDAPVSFPKKVLSTITGEAPCDFCEALAEEQNSERSEILSLIGKGPLLAPLDGSPFQLTHSGQALFSLSERNRVQDQVARAGIEHPPRV